MIEKATDALAKDQLGEDDLILVEAAFNAVANIIGRYGEVLERIKAGNITADHGLALLERIKMDADNLTKTN